MPSHSKALKPKRFMSAEKGKKLPSFDISGESGRITGLLEKLNGCLDDMNRVMGKEFRSILGSSAIRVEVSKWSEAAPDANELWFESSAQEQPDASPAFAISKSSLFSITEVFFGDNPKNLSDKDLEKRKITETEIRILSRLTNSMLGITGSATEHSAEYWNLSKIEDAPKLDAIWAKVEVSTDDWEIVMWMGWPKAFYIMESRHAEPSFTREEMESALLGMKIRTKAEVGQLSTNLADLQCIKPGDILEFNMPEETPVLAEGVKCLSGKIFETNDQLGLRINHNLGMKP